MTELGIVGLWNGGHNQQGKKWEERKAETSAASAEKSGVPWRIYKHSIGLDYGEITVW